MYLIVRVFLFFFSSRRRHTRWPRDWSSDVCSSDLEVGRLSRAFASMLAALTRSRDQQQRLVQDAGHELRTPLTSVRANIDTLRRHPDLAAGPRGQVLADLDSELRELSSLVEELVALAVTATTTSRSRRS